MSDVKRYRRLLGVHPNSFMAEVVGARDYDAALSELSALREELAKFDEGMRALACSLGAGGYNAETLTADQLVGKVQWGIDNIITVKEQRLAAAEQRNAELVELLKRIDRTPIDRWYRDALNVAVAAAIKPTESGASE
jgi:hypothetical protein